MSTISSTHRKVITGKICWKDDAKSTWTTFVIVRDTGMMFGELWYVSIYWSYLLMLKLTRLRLSTLKSQPPADIWLPSPLYQFLCISSHNIACLAYQRDSQHNPNRPIPLINASAPDARFIYEAVDAAKSLLSIFNNFVGPETLRYMPSSYYLFIIYSTVFLYKVCCRSEFSWPL
jgi:hypothetical protein